LAFIFVTSESACVLSVYMSVALLRFVEMVC